MARHTRRVSWRRWDVAWGEALYAPAGFYRHAAPADHFATSAQGLGSAGELLAEALLTMATRHGLTRIVEVAAGRGELLTDLARARNRAARHGSTGVAPTGPGGVRLTGIEIVDRPDDLPPDVDWLVAPGGAALPDALTGLTGTLLVAHEWLDVVPCPVVERGADGGWHHIEVDAAGVERTGTPVADADLDWLRCHLPGGVQRAEVGLTRDRAYRDLVSRVDHGLVVAIDYGHTYPARPQTGTLTGYRDGVQVPPRPDGTCDLTAHVAVDTLGADRLHTQREALLDLLGPAPLPPHGLSRTDPTAYLSQLTRANTQATLTRTGGLGDFFWAVTLRDGADLG